MAGGLQKARNGGSLAKYDPEKGLKKIALLEGVEKHFARAKDAAKLKVAIREKLDAQAEFVFWWDTQANKDKGGRPTKLSTGRVGGFDRLGEDGKPTERIVRRWRQKLNDRDAFERTYQQSVERYRKILEFDSTPHVSQNSGENEWYTPPEYIAAARAVLGEIDLDPASSDKANAVVQASQIFTLQESGLEKPWHGRVWMNPPYAQPLVGQFAAKLADSVKTGDVLAAVVLVNNATETAWFTAIADVSSAVCFPTGRVRFWSPTKETAAPLQGQAVLYAGPNTDGFCTEFRSFGLIARFEH